MTYEEKGAWVYLLVITGSYLGYIVLVLGRSGSGPIAETAYRSTMVWSMGVAVGLAVIGRIAVEITRPSETHTMDARDREIDRFSEYIGGSVLAVGMLLPFALVLLEVANFWIANAMYAVFALSAIVGSGTKVLTYRRGLQGWS